MNYVKIVPGVVRQTYNDVGECIKQVFETDNYAEYETEEGDLINEMDMPLGGNEYFPFNMEQPI